MQLVGTTKPMNRPNIPSLTSLRFFASLAVVIFHYSIGHTLIHFPFGIANFGYEAVTFFFVLSGFILTYVHVKNIGPEQLNLPLKDFAHLRIARIAPAYLLGLALATPFFLLGFIKQHQPAAQTFLWGLVLVPAGMQAWYPPTALLWNSPAWSLSVEIFLYASFVPFVKVARRIDQLRLVIFAYVIVICIALLVKIGLANNPFSTIANSSWHNFVAYLPLWHLPQFIFGVALARLFVSKRVASNATHEIILLSSIFAVAAIIVFLRRFPILSNNTILAPVFGAMIFGAAGAEGPLSRLLAMRWLVLLGDASYATYIIHVPLWQWWNHVTANLFTIQLSPITDFSCYLLVVIAGSIFTFKYIEKPVRRWLLSSTAHQHVSGTDSTVS